MCGVPLWEVLYLRFPYAESWGKPQSVLTALVVLEGGDLGTTPL